MMSGKKVNPRMRYRMTQVLVLRPRYIIHHTYEGHHSKTKEEPQIATKNSKQSGDGHRIFLGVGNRFKVEVIETHDRVVRQNF